MKIDHMIFNSKKWYEGQMPNYIGKTIKAPSNYLDSYYSTPGQNKTVEKNGAGWKPQSGLKVLGQIELDNEVYILSGYPHDYNWVKLNDLIKNGGVQSSLLNYLYHALTLLERREQTWQ